MLICIHSFIIDYLSHTFFYFIIFFILLSLIISFLYDIDHFLFCTLYTSSSGHCVCMCVWLFGFAQCIYVPTYLFVYPCSFVRTFIHLFIYFVYLLIYFCISPSFHLSKHFSTFDSWYDHSLFSIRIITSILYTLLSFSTNLIFLKSSIFKKKLHFFLIFLGFCQRRFCDFFNSSDNTSCLDHSFSHFHH